MVNKYADSEFRIFKFQLFIFTVVVYKLVNRLIKIQNEHLNYIPIVLMVLIIAKEVSDLNESRPTIGSAVHP